MSLLVAAATVRSLEVGLAHLVDRRLARGLESPSPSIAALRPMGRSRLGQALDGILRGGDPEPLVEVGAGEGERSAPALRRGGDDRGRECEQ
jgi:hypothetical protein